MDTRIVDQIERLAAAVEVEEARGGSPARRSSNAKLLAAITHLVYDEIPRDPTRKEYRQGDTLGPHRKHWFRAKFGGGRFRLFFRFRTDARIILYVWVNDAETLRTYGSRTDAYAVFARMLDNGDPPDDWDQLLAAAESPAARQQAAALTTRLRNRSKM